MPARIRPPHSEELPRLPDLEMAAGTRFRSMGLDRVADAPPLTLHALRAAHAAGRVWVAEMPVGFSPRLGGFAVADVVDGQAHLEEVSVHPDCAGRKLGARLIEAVEAWAQKSGYLRLTLSTFQTVPWNAPYYARLGFEILPPNEHGTELRTRIHEEARRGLLPEDRVVMVKSL